MVVQVAPLSSHVGETVCSLNFGHRVRCVELGPATAIRTPANGASNSSANQEVSALVSCTSSGPEFAYRFRSPTAILRLLSGRQARISKLGMGGDEVIGWDFVLNLSFCNMGTLLPVPGFSACF